MDATTSTIAEPIGMTTSSAQSYPEPVRLPLVDLISYFLGGASLLIFVGNSVLREYELFGSERADASLIAIGEPYDPYRIRTEILNFISNSCANDTNCIEIEHQLETTDHRGVWHPSLVPVLPDVPDVLRLLVAKLNYGVDHAVLPMFSMDVRGVSNFAAIVLLVCAYSLGFWRRFLIARLAWRDRIS